MRKVWACVARVGAISLSMGVASTAAAAQGWVQLPNGQLGYMTSYVTSGFFTCSRYIVVGGCTAQGNSVVLTNGGTSLAITFKGVTHQVLATPKGSQPFQMGVFTHSTTGAGPFVMPTLASKHAPLIGFNFNISTILPTAQSRSFNLGFMRGNGALPSVNFTGTNNAVFGVTAPPPPSTYGLLVYNRIVAPTLPADDGTSDFYATTASITPEPATLALLGTGLAGVGAIVRRRARRTRKSA